MNDTKKHTTKSSETIPLTQPISRKINGISDNMLTFLKIYCFVITNWTVWLKIQTAEHLWLIRKYLSIQYILVGGKIFSGTTVACSKKFIGEREKSSGNSPWNQRGIFEQHLIYFVVQGSKAFMKKILPQGPWPPWTKSLKTFTVLYTNFPPEAESLDETKNYICDGSYSRKQINPDMHIDKSEV
jgi:hypothetical protein